MLQLKHKTVFDSVSNTELTPNLTIQCCTIQSVSSKSSPKTVGCFPVQCVTGRHKQSTKHHRGRDARP